MRPLQEVRLIEGLAVSQKEAWPCQQELKSKERVLTLGHSARRITLGYLSKKNKFWILAKTRPRICLVKPPEQILICYFSNPAIISKLNIVFLKIQNTIRY
jgi:hypothetical protein